MVKIKCLICGDVLVGDEKGTFMQCSCKNIYVDETEYYCRVGFKDETKYKILKNFKRKRVSLDDKKGNKRTRNNN